MNLLSLQDVSKQYEHKVILNRISFHISKDERIAIVGKNGSGKSSLLKMLLGEQKPDSGVIKVGEISIGYFDQHTSMLEDDKDLLSIFCPNGGEYIDVRGKHMHVYGYLKNFLFPKEQLFQKIGALSGGEKNRVALALLFTKEVDVLILDEPTNDLDIQTINIVEEYLLSLSCAVIFVSHDRYFVDKLAHKLLIFEGEGEVIQSHMPYSEYLEITQDLRDIACFESSMEKFESVDKATLKIPKEDKLDSKKPTKLSYKQTLALQNLPREIEELEKKQKVLQEALSNPKEYERQGIVALAEELSKVEEEIESKITQYLLLEEKNMTLSHQA